MNRKIILAFAVFTLSFSVILQALAAPDTASGALTGERRHKPLMPAKPAKNNNVTRQKTVILSRKRLADWRKSKNRLIMLLRQSNGIARQKIVNRKILTELKSADQLMSKMEMMQRPAQLNRNQLKKISQEIQRHEKALKDLQDELSSMTSTDIGQDLNLRLQDAMQKQQQVMQILSNILKNQHDTLKSIIQNMRS